MVRTVRSGALAVVWPITGTVEQARGKAPAMSRPSKSNAECLATGRKTLEVSETFLKLKNFSQLLIIFSHHFYFWRLIFIFSAFVLLCISVCSVHFILSYILNCNSFHAADCKYKFGNWGECDTATSTKSRTGTFVKALFNVDCQQTVSVSKPCTTKVKNKSKGTPSTPNPKLTYLSFF